ncbi:TPA: hypothetical protein ACFIY3_000470 [Neisseria gonorrhoeae]
MNEDKYRENMTWDEIENVVGTLVSKERMLKSNSFLSIKNSKNRLA